MSHLPFPSRLMIGWEKSILPMTVLARSLHGLLPVACKAIIGTDGLGSIFSGFLVAGPAFNICMGSMQKLGILIGRSRSTAFKFNAFNIIMAASTRVFGRKARLVSILSRVVTDRILQVFGMTRLAELTLGVG
jgi:hypothetical protein